MYWLCFWSLVTKDLICLSTLKTTDKVKICVNDHVAVNNFCAVALDFRLKFISLYTRFVNHCKVHCTIGATMLTHKKKTVAVDNSK